MAATDLAQSDFDLAFSFSRSEAAPFRDAQGNVQSAPQDTPRFGFGAAGDPIGLIISPGADLGGQDRVRIDPLMLPAGLVEPENAIEAAATIFHAFIPQGASEVERRAIYSRNSAVSINALLRQSGNHLEIGVVAGFRENLNGVVRFRQQEWKLPGAVEAGDRILADGDGHSVISAGAELAGNG